jgi:hypothetical protein
MIVQIGAKKFHKYPLCDLINIFEGFSQFWVIIVLNEKNLFKFR